MSNPGHAIEIRGLSKSFGRTPVIRDLDLEVPWGEVLTVLGPNGSGKTTLIRVLATLARPDAGEIRVAGLDPVRSGQLVRRVNGVVTHEPMLYDDLSGYENLHLAGRMFGLDNLHDRVASVAERLGLASRLDQRAGTLSNGLRKRISIARAILHDPAILLLDEPETGLDQEALGMLDAVIRDGPRTVLMATHSIERGLSLGHRIAVLSGGRISHMEKIDSSLNADSFKQVYARHAGQPE